MRPTQCSRTGFRKVARAVVTAAVLALASRPGRADAQPHATTPTFNRDVAPILYRNCVACHRPQGIAPMPLITYKEAIEYAGEIREAVATAYMPPWHAEGPHGTFSNDRRLSEADKQAIVQWVDGKVPEGDAGDLPPAPVFTSAWFVGTPDAVLTMPQEFEVPATGTIEYQYFEIPTNFTEDKWIQAIEVMPGAREVVHHVLVYARPPAPATPPPAPPPGTPRPQPLLIFREDHATPEPKPGPDGQPRRMGPLIAGIAPGTEVQTFPAGTALLVRAGSVITLQMHYTAHGRAMKDRTQVGLVFAKEPPEEQIRVTAFSNGSFTIPAGASNVSVPSEVGFREAVRVWGILPHTHLRGKKWEYRLVQPDGKSAVVLSVPEYDFNWQPYYMFAQPLVVPAGGRIEATAWYDNSAANKANPNPKVDVKWGDQTWEEMQFSAFMYTIDSRRLRPAR